jgi:hypothetical protein
MPTIGALSDSLAPDIFNSVGFVMFILADMSEAGGNAGVDL